jgi:asparagine synthetase B (glutamine-hydrolysing)
MCSILVTNRNIQNFDGVNYFLKLRGPDHTSVYNHQGVTFVHNLLSISGAFTPQPFVEGNIVALHNGEIYNYGDYASDGLVIIPTYKNKGIEFTKDFDGEFAVVVADFDQNHIIFSTDLFKTKPLFVAVNGTDFGISTYSTPLQRLGFVEIQRVPANSIMKLCLNTMALTKVSSIYEWDLRQHKTTFDDWISAFDRSIEKRTSRLRERIFIGLSAGYDSGSIACAMDLRGVDYKAYSVSGSEDENILNQRIRQHHQFLHRNTPEWEASFRHIILNTEEFKYTIHSSSSDYNEYHRSLTHDSGSRGLALICDQARKEGFKIYLSGSGADEIISDYGYAGNKIFPHSNFGGLFPEDLSTIFPWASFYGSTMESYLAKEEYVSGSYGIEGRYPFLDRDVVQEFLWLSADLKNAKYKSCIDEYLMRNSYPYQPGVKTGF